jgi:hypothetical protein
MIQSAFQHRRLSSMLPRTSSPRLLATLVLSCIAFTGCAKGQVQAEKAEAQIACASPRPEMCTKEYMPVCASEDTGIRCVTTPCPSVESKTYGNACDACSNPKVTGYRPGSCADSKRDSQR